MPLANGCAADFETQGAYTLANKFDPEGKRTIGGIKYAIMTLGFLLLTVIFRRTYEA